MLVHCLTFFVDHAKRSVVGFHIIMMNFIKIVGSDRLGKVQAYLTGVSLGVLLGTGVQDHPRVPP